jgi:hypothetical protein
MRRITRKIWKIISALFCLLFAALLVFCAIGLVSVSPEITLFRMAYILVTLFGGALILVGVAFNLVYNTWRKNKCQEEEDDA